MEDFSSDQVIHSTGNLTLWTRSCWEIAWGLLASTNLCCRLPWWLRQWRICLQFRRPEFDPWVRKITWRREWPPTPLFLPEEFLGQKSLAGYSRWGGKSRTGLTNTHRDTQFAMLWKLFMILPIRVRQYHEGFSLFSIHIREIGEDFCDEDLIACNVQWISLSPEFQKLNLCFYKWLLFFIWIFSIYINPMENTP